VPNDSLRLPIDTPAKIEEAKRFLRRLGLEESVETGIFQWLDELSDGQRGMGSACGLLRLSRVGFEVAAILMTVYVVTREEAEQYPEHFSYEGLRENSSHLDFLKMPDGSDIQIVEFLHTDQGSPGTIYDTRVAIVEGLPGNMVARFNAQTNTMSIGAALTSAFREWLASVEWLTDEVVGTL
jgi:hypothetical protein